MPHGLNNKYALDLFAQNPLYLKVLANEADPSQFKAVLLMRTIHSDVLSPAIILSRIF